MALLGELASKDRYSITIGPFGSKMKADTYVESGIPVIRGTNIGPTRGLKGDWVYINSDLAATMPNCLLKDGDLVFPHRGSIGEVALIDKPDDPLFLSSSMMKFRPNADKLLSQFAYYYFRSDAGRSEILRFASSVGTPGIGQPLASLRQFAIPLPDVGTQTAIAKILSTLDDTIELNQRVNMTLERMAKAIFHDWFVDFGPVRRKQDGVADPVTVLGSVVLDPALAGKLSALFPATFGRSGLPLGWTERPFSSFVSIIGGGTPKTSIEAYWHGDIPWFSVTDTPSGNDIFVYDTEKSITRDGLEASAARLVPIGTTIISARGTVGNLALAGREMTFNQSCYGLVPTKGGSPYLTYLLAAHLVLSLKNMAHGSVFATITRQTFDNVTFVQATSQVLAEFERIISPMFAQIAVRVRENRTLAETRDYLLPRLMSGRVRVADAERLAG